jgi:hypothetical protein
LIEEQEKGALANSNKTTKSRQHPGILFQRSTSVHPQVDLIKMFSHLSIPANDIAVDIDKELDPVENLNHLIAQQQAQLEKLQNALAALKAP